MKISEEVAGLSQRVDGVGQRIDSLDQRVDKIDQRLDRFETRVDERFEAIDERFDEVDSRFDSVDLRLGELRTRFDVTAEASRDDFRNLYDLFQAHMQRMEGRMDTLAANVRVEMKLGYDALDRRVTVLERREQSRSKRTRH